MLYGEKREDLRNTFFEVMRKHNNNEFLDPLEKKILHILVQHKEYRSFFENPEKNLDKDFLPELDEANPFLHISLHLTLLEQISIDQPIGITKLYKQCIKVFGDLHEAEHCIMNSLAIGLNDLQKTKSPFDEKKYFKRIKRALKDRRW